jgi:hypothetical protein
MNKFLKMILKMLSAWPRHLVVQCPSDPAGFRKMSPFVIEKTLQGLIGTATNTKWLRFGDLLGEVGRRAQSDKLLSVLKFYTHSVFGTPHRSLHYCKGIIRCREIQDVSDDDILEELKTQRVREVK